jgi:hypothetical protein
MAGLITVHFAASMLPRTRGSARNWDVMLLPLNMLPFKFRPLPNIAVFASSKITINKSYHPLQLLEI